MKSKKLHKLWPLDNTGNLKLRVCVQKEKKNPGDEVWAGRAREKMKKKNKDNRIVLHICVSLRNDSVP